MNPSSPWSSPSTVGGFASGSPNQALIEFARGELARTDNLRALDIGCGAGRNAVPLAAQGWRVLGLDLSWAMLAAAAYRARDESVGERCLVAQAAMHRLPVAGRSCGLIVAHGIWNLARSDAEFRDAVREAARVATPGAALFVFTFSRSMLAESAPPVPGQSLVFPNLSGEPQTYLTRQQLTEELGAAGFVPDPAQPLREVNPSLPGMLMAAGSPVIWEAVFRAAG
jgi:SAM-dependent methyltransferase